MLENLSYDEIKSIVAVGIDTTGSTPCLTDREGVPLALLPEFSDNMQFRRIYSNQVDRTTGIIYDQIGKLVTYSSLKFYPEKLRRIKYYDAETYKVFILITYNMELAALEITLLYKNVGKLNCSLNG